MIESQLLHLMLQKQLIPVFCEFIEKCLQCLQRGDLQQIFLQGTCGKTGCQVHSRNKDSTEEEYYKQGQGLCVIINQKKFYKDRHHPYSQQLDHRLGTDIDRNELEATFLLFGADIIIKDDLTHQEMLDELEIAADKANTHNYAWVTVCVLSHGRRLNGVDEILGCNGVGIDRKKVWTLHSIRFDIIYTDTLHVLVSVLVIFVKIDQLLLVGFSCVGSHPLWCPTNFSVLGAISNGA